MPVSGAASSSSCARNIALVSSTAVKAIATAGVSTVCTASSAGFVKL